MYMCFHCSNIPIMFFKIIIICWFLMERYFLQNVFCLKKRHKQCAKILYQMFGKKIFVHVIFDNLKMIGITEQNSLVEIFGVYM